MVVRFPVIHDVLEQCSWRDDNGVNYAIAPDYTIHIDTSSSYIHNQSPCGA